MYLKFIVAGPLEKIVRAVWPEASEDDMIRDYENVYEWVWLSLPDDGVRLNISREHEWGDDAESGRVSPIYVAPFEIEREAFLDLIPPKIVERISITHCCKVEAFDGRPNVDEEDGVPIKVYQERKRENRVGMAGLRLPPLPHHPACGSAPGGSSKTR